MPSPKTLKLALLGLGRAGQFHLQSIQSNPGTSLLYAVDIDETRARNVASKFNCSFGTNSQAALADPDVDAVIVATPTLDHFDHITASLDAGKAVFTEKPLGSSLEEIDICFNLAKEKGLPLFVGFNRRFDPSFAKIARDFQNGLIGTPQMLRITSRDSPLPSMDYIKTSHGIFHDCIVHDFDMLRYITGEDPVEIYAIGSSFVESIKALNDLDNVLITLKYGSGMLASIDVNRFAAYGYDQRIEAFGDKGMLQAENKSPLSTVLASCAGMTRPPIEHSFPSRYREAYRLELISFQDSVLEGSPLAITHDEVRMSFVLSDYAERSYREQKPIPITAGLFAQPAK